MHFERFGQLFLRSWTLKLRFLGWIVFAGYTGLQFGVGSATFDGYCGWILQI